MNSTTKINPVGDNSCQPIAGADGHAQRRPAAQIIACSRDPVHLAIPLKDHPGADETNAGG